MSLSLSPQEDEEWKEFEQKEVDYTGLRLQALQMRCEEKMVDLNNAFHPTDDHTFDAVCMTISYSKYSQ